MRRTILTTLLAFAVALSLGLSGCASHKPKPGGQSGTESGAAGQGGVSGLGAGPAGSAGSGSPDDEVAGPQGAQLAKRIVYFDFDNSEIKGEGTDIVAAHAKYLSSNPSARVRLEGHTDERGSREYNVGLGERRAQSVRRALMLQGASDGQISTVSYGEERPAEAGHDEAAWAKNRRVEIIYVTPGAPGAAARP